MNNDKQVKLHLGCFQKKIHGFINIDIREDVQPDVIDDVFKLDKFKNDSVDLIYVCHVLEHATRAGSKQAMRRWFEVLKPGGVLRVAVPDLGAAMEYYIANKDLDILQALLYGSQRHAYDFHYMGWDEKSLSRDLKVAGFQSVKKYDWRDTEHFYIDDYSQCYLPKMAYTTRRKDSDIEGKLVSLNLEATK